MDKDKVVRLAKVIATPLYNEAKSDKDKVSAFLFHASMCVALIGAISIDKLPKNIIEYIESRRELVGEIDSESETALTRLVYEIYDLDAHDTPKDVSVAEYKALMMDFIKTYTDETEEEIISSMNECNTFIVLKEEIDKIRKSKKNED
jgi:hypothetical protein